MTTSWYQNGWRTALIALVVAVALFVTAVVVFYTVDTGREPHTIRGLRIDGLPAGNMSDDELGLLLDEIDSDIGSREVQINLADRSTTFSAADLGVSLNRSDVEARALSAGRAGGTFDRFRAWLASFTATISISTKMSYDPEIASATVAQISDLVVEKPTEPRLIHATGEGLVVVPGADGIQIDQEAVVSRLANQVEAGGPFRVDAPTQPLPPETTDGEMVEMAKKLNDLTADGLEVRLGDTTKRISARSLRTRLDVTTANGGRRPVFDLKSLQRLVELTFRNDGDMGTDPEFEILDDVPVLVEEGSPPTECCQPGTASAIAQAVVDDVAGPLRVEARPVNDPDKIEWASGSQIVEKVSEFTTEHSCCQARVTNIQKFADIVRGVYLVPGESLSLNEHVGQRTRERGFVPAGTILQGHLVPTVGGGVSQFATTMFNAAFFAGFDFVDYQSHSIYFSRYPYGREATISWPAPDLEFTNTTAYPALIWTSYDDTSITVSIYSTKSVEVTELGQEVSSARSCTRVDTFRLRTYDDGSEVEDSVFATYRPAEGLDCNGNPTDKPDS